MSKRPWCGGPDHQLRRLINCPGIIIINIHIIIIIIIIIILLLLLLFYFQFKQGIDS